VPTVDEKMTCFVCFLVRYASNITEIVITGATRERFIVIPGGS